MLIDKNSKSKEQVIILGVGLKKDSYSEIKDSLLELEDLVHTAGGEVVGSIVQVLEKYTPATFIGSGKVDELTELCQSTEAQLVVVDHSLSGVQIRNLEKKWSLRVIDRSQLILDIFAQRAQTYEGKLQVELAQMSDQLPRMVGGWLGSLSRLAGGIGTRGPGEKALELDRRVIHNKIKLIRAKLKNVSRHRRQHRAKRRRSKIPSFALIGYTNSGKSTLLNLLTSSKVLSKDQLFATLDPTTRKFYLPSLGDALITDTVGFIRKLPTQLIEAFKATLEESGDADILIHVIDLASPQMEQQIEVVENLIKEFAWDNKPIISVFNKLDVAPPHSQYKVKIHPRAFISAKNNEGIDKLKTILTDGYLSLTEEYELYFPIINQDLIFELARESKINKKEQASNGTLVYAHLTTQQLNKWGSFLA